MDKKKEAVDDFAALFPDVKPVKHNRYVLNKRERIAQLAAKKTKSAPKEARRHMASIALSDEYEAYWPEGKPITFARQDDAVSKDWVKKLSRAMIAPELSVDMHGLLAKQAKETVVLALADAKKNNYLCVQFIHGHGNGVLKHKTPNWLVQHPDVWAFVRAPKQYGGNSALLVLLNQFSGKSPLY